MIRRILITGSSGLVGTALASAIARGGINVARIDIQASGLW